MKTRLYNNYDYYLILLLAFRALGGLGGLWGFTRLLEIFLLPQMLLRVPYTNNKYKTYYLSLPPVQNNTVPPGFPKGHLSPVLFFLYRFSYHPKPGHS